MRKRRVVSLLLTGFLCLSLMTACDNAVIGGSDAPVNPAPVDVEGMDLAFSVKDNNGTYSEASAVKITLADGASSADGEGVAVSGDTVTVTAAGTYILTGKLTNGSVKVFVPKTDKVQLVLKNVSLHNDNGPALYVAQAEKVFVTLAEGSKNALSDGNGYFTNDGDTNLDAALFSKEDLTLNGLGTLTVKGNYKHAVVSNDDLVVTEGTYHIVATDVGLKGKDSVKIGGGTIHIESGSDGIRADNDTDPTRGYFYMTDGKLTVRTENDGVQAHTLLRVVGGTIDVVAGGGKSQASVHTGSGRGLKSYSLLQIWGGEITLDSADDCLHANGTIEMTGGTLHCSTEEEDLHKTLGQVSGN